jgi:hypothetical protein
MLHALTVPLNTLVHTCNWGITLKLALLYPSPLCRFKNGYRQTCGKGTASVHDVKVLNRYNYHFHPCVKRSLFSIFACFEGCVKFQTTAGVSINAWLYKNPIASLSNLPWPLCLIWSTFLSGSHTKGFFCRVFYSSHTSVWSTRWSYLILDINSMIWSTTSTSIDILIFGVHMVDTKAHFTTGHS